MLNIQKLRLKLQQSTVENSDMQVLLDVLVNLKDTSRKLVRSTAL